SPSPPTPEPMSSQKFAGRQAKITIQIATASGIAHRIAASASGCRSAPEDITAACGGRVLLQWDHERRTRKRSPGFSALRHLQVAAGGEPASGRAEATE